MLSLGGNLVVNSISCRLRPAKKWRQNLEIGWGSA